MKMKNRWKDFSHCFNLLNSVQEYHISLGNCDIGKEMTNICELDRPVQRDHTHTSTHTNLANQQERVFDTVSI